MRLHQTILLAAVLIFPAFVRADDKPEPVKILLLGDSTTIGSVCRSVAPQADHLEQVVQKLLAGEKDLPATQVINRGQDGDTIQRLLTSGRYDKDVLPLKTVDYVFIRYGLNDLGRREEFAKNFPLDFRELIERLRKDFPQAVIIPMTVIPYLGAENDKKINDIVKTVATEQKLPLFDIYPRYSDELKKGENMLNYRRAALTAVPERYHALLGSMKMGDAVVVLDNTLDAHLSGVPGWFGDRHPNLAGYHVIGDETAKFLAPLLRERKKATNGK